MKRHGAPSFASQIASTLKSWDSSDTLFEQGGAQHVIANSHMVQKEIIREFAYPADKITVVYNGLPDLHFKKKPENRDEMRRALGLKETDVVLLFAGSGWNRKGLNYAIQAFGRISNHDVSPFGGRNRQEKGWNLEEGAFSRSGGGYAFAFSRRPTFSFCRRFTTRFLTPAWKLFPTDCPSSPPPPTASQKSLNPAFTAR